MTLCNCHICFLNTVYAQQKSVGRNVARLISAAQQAQQAVPALIVNILLWYAGLGATYGRKYYGVWRFFAKRDISVDPLDSIKGGIKEALIRVIAVAMLFVLLTTGQPGQQKTPPKFVSSGVRASAPATLAPPTSTTACTAVFIVPTPIPQCDVPKTNLRLPQRIFTPLQRHGFEQFLTAHPDQNFVSNILNILQFGADIGYRGPQFPRLTANFASARQHANVSKRYQPKLPYFILSDRFLHPICLTLCATRSKCAPKRTENFELYWISADHPDTVSTIT